MSRAAADVAEIRRWMELLHGSSSGLVHVSATDGWIGRAFRDLDEAAQWAVEQGHRSGVYVRCTTLAPTFAGIGRGSAVDSYELPGLWADLDLRGPGHAEPPQGLLLLPDIDAAYSLVADLPRPTLWVHSGGGLYPWWLLHEPFRLDTDISRVQDLSTRWHAYLTERARASGWHVGGTGDLARVLRIPGTVNRKAGGQRPCLVLEHAGPRYSLEDLEAALTEVAPQSGGLPGQPARTPPVFGRRGGAAISKGSGRDTLGRDWLASLPAGMPCHVVLERRDQLIEGLAESSRHRSITGPLLGLVRLAQRRHRGVAQAVIDVRAAFLESVRGDRPLPAALSEWDRALEGAIAAVRTDGPPPLHPVCNCRMRRLTALAERTALFSRGVAGLNERKVLRYLLHRAGLSGSLLVQESQRQIAEAIDVHQPTISKTLRQLREKGWLEPVRAGRAGVSDSYSLREPTAAEQTLSTKTKTPAGVLVDNSLPARVHPLFGADGLGPGVAETFAALPELYRRLPKVVLVGVRPGSKDTEGLRSPYRGTRRIPGPARPGARVTVSALAAHTGKNPRTVRKHLALLARHGMAVDHDGCWSRLRFDPQALVAELGIVDTAARKAQEYARQRRGYYDHLCRSRGGRPPTAVRTTADARVVYSDPSTGEELWSCPVELLDEDIA